MNINPPEKPSWSSGSEIIKWAQKLLPSKNLGPIRAKEQKDPGGLTGQVFDTKIKQEGNFLSRMLSRFFKPHKWKKGSSSKCEARLSQISTVIISPKAPRVPSPAKTPAPQIVKTPSKAISTEEADRAAADGIKFMDLQQHVSDGKYSLARKLAAQIKSPSLQDDIKELLNELPEDKDEIAKQQFDDLKKLGSIFRSMQRYADKPNMRDITYAKQQFDGIKDPEVKKFAIAFLDASGELIQAKRSDRLNRILDNLTADTPINIERNDNLNRLAAKANLDPFEYVENIMKRLRPYFGPE